MYQVFAGNHDRKNTPVWFDIPAADLPAAQVAVKADGGTILPATVVVNGDQARVTFVIDHLACGEAFRFELVPCDCAPENKAEINGNQVDLTVSGKYFSKYYFGDDLAKPYMGPFYEKYGKQMTRLNFTIKEHPHHRSLWVSHGDIDGVDNWNERPEHGYIINQGIDGVVSSPAYCEFTAHNVWTKHDKTTKQCDEVTTYRIYNTSDEVRVMDVTIRLVASYGAFTLGKTKEAGPIAVRMNDELVVGKTGRFETPDGINEDEIWMKRAPWCDYCGTAEGHRCGITIMDCPDNFGYPTYWHSRNYGLMAPNNSFIPEPRRIEAGDEAKWTFRVVIHNGDTRSAEISERYADFVAMPLVADRDQDEVKVLWPVDPERAKIPFKLPEDLTGWPEIPVWQKDVRAFVEKVKELGLMPERK